MKETVEDYVRRLVDAAPPLTEEQRHRIAAILRTGTSAPTTKPTPGR